MNIDFFKYQSIGNDFVLVESSSLPSIPLDELAVKVCNRRFGVGSDGLLVVSKTPSEISMRMFNPDGTEDFCGNGLRIAGLHMRLSGMSEHDLKIRHFGREIAVSFSSDGWIEIAGLRASFDPIDVPLAPGMGELFETGFEIDGRILFLSSINTGSTHSVISLDRAPGDFEFRQLSSKLEHHPMFPERTSVIWCWPEGDERVRIRIWERGVGETLGCGTGSAAVGACYFRKHSSLKFLEVANPGGLCVVSRGREGGLNVRARASRVFVGTFFLVQVPYRSAVSGESLVQP
jgi:diaminopimelate epimerase